MHPYVNTAVRAARSAANIIVRAFERPDLIKVSKKGPNDFVTDIDKKAEQDIVHLLQTAYPGHGFLSEEGTLIKGDSYQWIIDPIDGTLNFIQGIPHFCISIALKHENRIEHAVIYDPLKNDLFTASRGEGTQKNNRKIRVSKKRHLSECLIGVGLPTPSSEYHTAYYETLNKLSHQCIGFRRMGSAALDLAYVASGQLDGFFETGLRPWDIGAGILMIKEAGGLISDVFGAENHFKNGTVLTANYMIFKELLKNVQPIFSQTNK